MRPFNPSLLPDFGSVNDTSLATLIRVILLVFDSRRLDEANQESHPSVDTDSPKEFFGVHSHRAFRERERSRDILIGASAADQPGDFRLPHRQPVLFGQVIPLGVREEFREQRSHRPAFCTHALTFLQYKVHES